MAAEARSHQIAAILRREALTIAAIVMLAVVAVGGVRYFSEARNDRSPALFGNDYASFYAAGRLALEGHPEAAYDRESHSAMQRRVVAEAKPGGRLDATYYFGYPPTYQALLTPFALLPYYPSLFLFLGLTAILYVVALWQIWPGWRTVLYVLAVPGACIAFGFGQNAFLTAGLVGLALVLLDRRPILAGILIGCLAFKPQLGLAFPLILVATGRWRTFGAAALTVAVTVGASLVWPGVAAWRGFAGIAGMSRSGLLETSVVGFGKIQSIFAALRLYGASIDAAYAAQAVLTLIVAISLVLVWRSGADYRLKAASACVATLLMTPFCLAYDLLIEVPAAAFFIAYGADRGFRSGDLVLVAFALLSPEIGATGAAGSLPVGFAGMALFYFVIARRAWTDPAVVPENAPAGLRRRGGLTGLA